MSIQIQLRRGTATQHTTFTGVLGEATVNTTNNSLHVHDGTTAGGFELLRKDLSNITSIPNSKLANSTISGISLGSNLAALTIGTGLTGTSYNGSTAVTIALANTAVTAGSYGSSTAVPVITIDAQGRITSASTASISGALTFSGDVTGTGTTGTTTTLTLANSGVTAGTYTKITVDAKGRATVGASATTTDIGEGTNLYYTQARFDTAFGAKTTTNLAEGTNLYYTQNRFDTAFGAKTTDNLTEGVTNLYYTNTRARAAHSAGTGISYNSTTGVISTAQDVSSSGSPTFAALTTTGNGSVGGNLTVTGNLTVNGTTEYLNSVTVQIADKNIELGVVTTPTDTTANGGGITIKGTTDKTFNWVSSTAAWTSSEHLALASGKTAIFNGSTSGSVIVQVPAIAGSNTLTLPAATDTLVGKATTDTLTNKTISGSSNTLTNIPNSALTNNSITINGASTALGGTATVSTLVNGSYTISATSTGQLQLPVITQGSTTGGVLVASGNLIFNANGNLWAFNSDGTMVSPYNVKISTTGITFPDATNQTTAYTGNATTATKLQTARNINGVAFDGSAAITIKASTTNALTIGTGLSGTSFDGGSAVTIAIDSTVATLTGTQTLTNKTLTDSTTYFQDDLDNTKKFQFQLSGITTGTTRTLTVPNVNGTIVTTGDTGSVTSAMIADGTIVDADISSTANIAVSKISGLAASATTDTTNATNISSGTLSASRLPAFSGDATSTAGTSALTLAASGVTAGTYGSSTAVPVLTVDAKGRVTVATTASISGAITIAGDATGTGTTGGTTTVTLATVNANVGSFGSSTQIPTITVNSKGLVTAVTTTAVSIPSGSISVTGGDLTLSGTTGTAITNATLAASGVTAGTYTKITVDAKGRATVGAQATTTDISEGTNLYYTSARFDAALAAKTTTNLAEGTNLYYTTARANTDFDSRLSSKSTTNLAEGTNLYYTDARARAALSVSGSLAYNSTTGVISYTTPTTSGITEGTNLYYTDARARAAHSAGTGISYNSLTGSIAVDTSVISTKSYVDTSVANLVAAAPATLDTLKELADAIGDDPNYATTVTNLVATKLSTSAFDSTFDARLALKSTSNLTEGTNLYFTTARARSSITAGGDLSYNSTTGVVSYTTPTTSGITEGTNLYYTAARVNSAFDTRLALKTTSDLAEGTNKYYTDARARAAISATGNATYNSTTGVINVGNPTVALSGLTDVAISAPVAQQVLKYNGSQWINANSDTAVASAVFAPQAQSDLGSVTDSIIGITEDLGTVTQLAYFVYDMGQLRLDGIVSLNNLDQSVKSDYISYSIIFGF